MLTLQHVHNIVANGARLDSHGVGPDDCDGCGVTDRDGLSHSEETQGLALCDPCNTLAFQWPGLFSEDPEVREAARQGRVCDLWLAGPEMAQFI